MWCPVADFYKEMQGIASELLTEFKQGVITYTPSAQPVNGWEPVTESTPTPIDATATGVAKQYIDDLITASDTMLTIKPFGQSPAMNGKITIDGNDRQIIKIKQIPAAGEPIVWMVFVKG